MVPTKLVYKTPYELWYENVPNLTYLKVWGCEALVMRDTPDKLQQRSFKCIFVGYPKEIIGYYFYFPPEVSGRAIKLNKIHDEDTSAFENTSEIPIEVKGFEPPQEELIIIRSLGDLNEPANYKAAMLDLEYDKWLDARNAMMKFMKDNQVWRLVDLPPNSHLVEKGFTKNYEVDYEETLSPVADIRAVRILIAKAAFYDYEIWKMSKLHS
ncbi:retrotransposon protein, putative, ty1-copia subclass [Tanacetum coccineum]